jgi:hypothetical protein
MDALQLPNQADKHTPLHLAVLYEADSETCFFLTDRCAKAAQAIDKDGNTPLHLACSGEEPELEVIEDLTEVRAISKACWKVLQNEFDCQRYCLQIKVS